jgi:tRNA(Ile)-lysidine synthase
MNGKKKLSDYFIDRKYNLIEKDDVWVLLSGKDIVWVVGERIDNRYCVCPESKEVLRLKLDK